MSGTQLTSVILCLDFAEPLGLCELNILGQTKRKLPMKRQGKKDEKKLSRDSVFMANWQKYRAGNILNPVNTSGEGDAAAFSLQFQSSTDSLASIPFKRFLAALEITDLSSLSFNVEEKIREPEAFTISVSMPPNETGGSLYP
jgi:hypothetical protein